MVLWAKGRLFSPFCSPIFFELSTTHMLLLCKKKVFINYFRDCLCPLFYSEDNSELTLITGFIFSATHPLKTPPPHSKIKEEKRKRKKVTQVLDFQTEILLK